MKIKKRIRVKKNAWCELLYGWCSLYIDQKAKAKVIELHNYT